MTVKLLMVCRPLAS